MKYKGIEIGIPTLEQIEECCREEKLRVPAIEVYQYYTKKKWLTGKHKPVMTLEAACAAVNGAFLKRLRKNEPFVPTYDGMNNNISKNDLEEFERLMGIIREKDPISWSKFFCMAANLVKKYDFSHTCEPQ